VPLARARAIPKIKCCRAADDKWSFFVMFSPSCRTVIGGLISSQLWVYFCRFPPTTGTLLKPPRPKHRDNHPAPEKFSVPTPIIPRPDKSRQPQSHGHRPHAPRSTDIAAKGPAAAVCLPAHRSRSDKLRFERPTAHRPVASSPSNAKLTAAPPRTSQQPNHPYKLQYSEPPSVEALFISLEQVPSPRQTTPRLSRTGWA
jgi:hypothetical protein